MEDGAGLVLKDVALDGTGLADGNQTINYSTADVDYGALRVEGSEIRNYVKGLMYLNVTAKVASITSITILFTILYAMEVISSIPEEVPSTFSHSPTTRFTTVQLAEILSATTTPHPASQR